MSEPPKKEVSTPRKPWDPNKFKRPALARPVRNLDPIQNETARTVDVSGMDKNLRGKPLEEKDGGIEKAPSEAAMGSISAPRIQQAQRKPEDGEAIHRIHESRSLSLGWRCGISVQQLHRSVDIISPPARLTPEQWGEANFYLPQEQNAEPGKFHFARRPHQAAMANDPIDPRVREIFWMGASQSMGKTVIQILLVCYVIHQMRKSIVMLRPTVDAGTDWKRDKLLPTIDVTPCMQGLLADPRKRDSKSTSINQRFPGGSLRLIGANSPSGFRSSSAAIVFQDEVDAYVENKEGDACALADRAAITFSDAWLIKASTTTLEGESRIHAGYLLGDQQKYFVPCPHCGGFQHLLTEQMKFSFTPEEHARFGDEKKKFKDIVNAFTWEIGQFPIKDTPRTIYVCEHCRHGWTDDQRIDAYLSGHKDNLPIVVNGQELRSEWRATAPFKGIRSRHFNGMYSIGGIKKEFASYLHMFAEGFLKAKREGRAALMVWTNIFKNEPFEDVSEKMDWAPLKERAEDIGPDLEPQAISVFGLADVQQEPPRVEILWMAFGALEESWLLERESISGDMEMPYMQENLWAHISAKRFKHPYLGSVGMSAFGIDYAHKTKAVLSFCSKHRFGKVFAVKGFGHESLSNALFDIKYDRRSKCYKVFLNVDVFKGTVFDRLRLGEAGPCYIHIPKETVTHVENGVKRTFRTNFGSKFYVELCSERRISQRNKDGTLTYRWKKFSESARNESLDCLVYGLGLYETQGLGAMIGQQWERVKKLMREREEKEGAVAQPVPVPTPAEIKKPEPAPATLSKFQDRGAKVQTQRNQGGAPPGRVLRRPVPRRQQQQRPPWARGMFNPLNV